MRRDQILAEMAAKLFDWNSEHADCETSCPHREDNAYHHQAVELLDLVISTLHPEEAP